MPYAIAPHAGYCAGVRKAMETAFSAAREAQERGIYCSSLGELIHNPQAVAALREAGVRTQIYTEKKKVKQKFAYADKLGIPYAVIIGEDECTGGVVSVKDLATGTQETMTPAAAAEKIAAAIREKQRIPVIKEK